jgi:hypothetical protein
MSQINLFSFLFLIWINSSFAVPYNSSFGFDVDLGPEWVVWNQKVSKINLISENLKKSDFNDISNLDTLSYEKMMKQVESGELEYFYDKSSLNEPMKNNMNIKLSNKKFEMGQKDAVKYCKSLPEQLPKIYHQSITVSYCGFFEIEKYRYFGVIFVMNDTKLAVFEYNMPTKEGKTLILVGGTDRAGSDRMQKGLNIMINAIAKVQ